MCGLHGANPGLVDEAVTDRVRHNGRTASVLMASFDGVNEPGQQAHINAEYGRQVAELTARAGGQGVMTSLQVVVLSRSAS